MINIRPHRDRVLLELIPEDKKSGGGIFIPDGTKKNYIRKGKVLALAKDFKHPRNHRIEIGQVVYAVWNCGNEIEIAGELPNGATNECRLLKSEDVWAME
jgi:co-chaperonin GroES (HSP10)